MPHAPMKTYETRLEPYFAHERMRKQKLSIDPAALIVWLVILVSMVTFYGFLGRLLYRWLT